MRRRPSTVLALGALMLAFAASVAPVGFPPAAAKQSEAPPGATRELQGTLAIGTTHLCMIFSGNVRCWGANISGQLGYGDRNNRGANPGDMENLPNVDLGPGRTAKALAAGARHTCAILDNNSLKCWGSNTDGQLGLGDRTFRGELPGQMGTNLPTVELGSGRTARLISAGENNTCAVLDDASLKCWGDNSFGQLGQGDSSDRGDAPGEMGDALAPIALGAGAGVTAIGTGPTTCAALVDGNVKCFGANDVGQLGQGDTQRRGDDPGEMAALGAVALGTGRRAVALATGLTHVCVLLDNATTKCWGSNAVGQAVSASAGPIGDGPGEMGDALAASPWGSGRTVLVITAVGDRTCALLDNRSVKCVGENNEGQAGYGDRVPHGLSGELGDSLAAVPLGTGRLVGLFTVGHFVSCASLDDGTLRCWGFNGSGQLGRPSGVPGNIGDAPGEMGDALLPVPFVATPSPTNKFVALTPSRLFDTRSGPGPLGQIPPNGSIVVQVSGNAGVPPADVSAVVLNLTTTQTLGAGHVTAYPGNGSPPLASNINVERSAQTIPNMVTVRLSPDGKAGFFTSAGGHLLADVLGYYTPITGMTAPGRFVPVVPSRMVDSRNGAGNRIPAGGTAFVQGIAVNGLPSIGVGALLLNVTITDTAGAGFVTVYPNNQPRPLASNLNSEGFAQTIANQVIVPLGGTGFVDVFTSMTTHLIVDLYGYFTDPNASVGASGLFVPLAPFRAFDTRIDATKLAAGDRRDLTMYGLGPIPASAVSAVAFNATMTETTAPGHLTVYPGNSGLPIVSTLNAVRAGQTIANHAIVPLDADTGNIRYFSFGGTHVVFDVNGWFTA